MESGSKVFDVAILGTGLSGLVAAIRLARENRSVLLLKEKKYQLSFKKDGYCFIPFSNFSEKLVQADLLKKIPLSTDRKGDQSGKDQIGQDVFSQVILPGVRIDLFREFSRLQKEWKREFPGELNQISDFYGELKQIKQFLKRIKSKEPEGSLFPILNKSLIKRWLTADNLPKGETEQWLSSFSPGFRKYIELQMISRGNLFATSFPLSLVSHLLYKDEGDERERGTDMEILTRSLFEKLAESGVRIEEIEKVENIEMERKGSFSVFLKGDDRVIRCRSLVINSPLHSISGVFNKRGKALSQWNKKIQPHYVLVPIFLGIRERVVPVGMKDLLISVQDFKRTCEGGNLLLLGLSRRGNEHQAPEGKRALTVMCFKPFEGLEKYDFSDLQEGVMHHLTHLFPFLENHIEFIDRTWAEDQLESWSYPHYYYKVTSDIQWRSGVMPIKISKRLYFSGRENFPYLGLEGEVLNGLRVGGEILRNAQ